MIGLLVPSLVAALIGVACGGSLARCLSARIAWWPVLLAAFAVEAADRGKTDPYITRLDSLERKRGPALWGDYLRAHLSGATQHLDHWERDMMKVADRLLQGNGFSQAVEIAQEILQEHPTAAGARILVRGAEGLGDKERLEDALEQAWAVDPGNARTAMRLAQLARERGDIPTSLEWTGSALKGLASEDDWTQLDECMVTIFDGEEPTSHISAIDILPELFRNGLEDKAREYLDLGLQRWQKEPYCGRLFETLREMLERGMASDELQPALRATMESRFGECPELQNFLSLSCLCLEGADYPACFKT